MEFMNDALSWLEKINTLLSSRRLWLTSAEAVLAVIAILVIVAPALDVDVDTSNLPDDEALADRLIAGTRSIAALIGGVVIVLRELASFANLRDSYHNRPPGFDKLKEE